MQAPSGWLVGSSMGFDCDLWCLWQRSCPLVLPLGSCPALSLHPYIPAPTPALRDRGSQTQPNNTVTPFRMKTGLFEMPSWKAYPAPSRHVAEGLPTQPMVHTLLGVAPIMG
uniref:Uncharacterized protein n=1 Tax=Eutreptiella gymnastica TaxID=73025 RepID=A0A7S1ISW4_9EUGL|mmetsp:Transcript_40810/g.73064  ORF Transcript_40810/g.73064 Transcript_40810/m.73064 type:complete len:112 (+) Transcript_40810:1267-1602(+)